MTINRRQPQRARRGTVMAIRNRIIGDGHNQSYVIDLIARHFDRVVYSHYLEGVGQEEYDRADALVRQIASENGWRIVNDPR